MTGHSPSHRRSAFLAWVNAGFPPTAEIEVDYEARTVPAAELLRMFVLHAPCTDYVPAVTRRTILDHLGYSGDVLPLSYGLAAMLLLAHRSGSVVSLLAALYPKEG